MKLWIVEQVDPRVQTLQGLGRHELEYNGHVVIVRAFKPVRACAIARKIFDEVSPMRDGDARYFHATELPTDGAEELLVVARGAS